MIAFPLGVIFGFGALVYVIGFKATVAAFKAKFAKK